VTDRSEAHAAIETSVALTVKSPVSRFKYPGPMGTVDPWAEMAARSKVALTGAVAGPELNVARISTSPSLPRVAARSQTSSGEVPLVTGRGHVLTAPPVAVRRSDVGIGAQVPPEGRYSKVTDDAPGPAAWSGNRRAVRASGSSGSGASMPRAPSLTWKCRGVDQLPAPSRARTWRYQTPSVIAWVKVVAV